MFYRLGTGSSPIRTYVMISDILMYLLADKENNYQMLEKIYVYKNIVPEVETLCAVSDCY